MLLPFDPAFYLRTNPDVAAAGVDAERHFNEIGFREGRDPTAFFDMSYYLAENGDIAAAGVNPFTHFNAFGVEEQRTFSPFFDADFYTSSNADVASAGANPIEHFLQFGMKEMRNFSPFFDADFYRQENPDVTAAGVNPIEHFLTFGVEEKREVNPFFDMAFYAQQNPDVIAAGLNPLQHFLEYGIKELRNPNVEVNMAQLASSNANFQQALTTGDVDIMRTIIGNAVEVVNKGGSITQAIALAARDDGDGMIVIPEGDVAEFFAENNIPSIPPFPFAGLIPPSANVPLSFTPPVAPPFTPPSTIVIPVIPPLTDGQLLVASVTQLGSPNIDTLIGTPDTDIFAPQAGTDVLTGNGGRDVFKNNGTTDDIDVIMDYDTDDLLVLGGLAREYFVTASNGSGNAKLQLSGVNGTDKTNGGFTFDNGNYADMAIEVDEEFADTVFFIGTGSSPSFIDVHTASFTVDNSDNLNILSGAAAAQIMTGLSTNDMMQITASGAHNVLRGNGGNDTLVGAGNADYLNGGIGADYIITGAGIDVIQYEIAEVHADRAMADTINDFTLGNGGDKIAFTNIGNPRALRGTGLDFDRGDASDVATTLGANVGFFVATNNITNVVNNNTDFSTANIFAALSGIAAEVTTGNIFYAMLSNGTDAVLTRITADAVSGLVNDTLEFVATFTGVTHVELEGFMASNTVEFVPISS